MRLVYSAGLWGLFLTIALWPRLSQATHVRAGEITTRRVSQTSLTYEVTFTAYFDEQGGKLASDQASEYTICFGDGTTAVVKRQEPRTYINGRTSSINIYRTTHTYSGPGTYTIGITVPNRNKNTVNLPPASSSDQIRFFVSTTILINGSLLTNSTPVMLNPPLDSGRVGQKFCHNPAAFDPDGDSLAYRLSVPATSLTDVGCTGRAIPSYQDPTRFSTASETGAAPSFSINALTGELCWDAPGQEGQYNFAFIIEEWRNGVLIGLITRDMQIIVTDSPNKRPLINPIADLCVEAGTLINQPITATDPDGNRVILTAYGGVFNVGADGAALPAGQLIAPAYARLQNGGLTQAQPATALFSWQTSCNQLREQPYEVIVKVTDVPPRPTPALVSFQSFNIRLVGPSVKGLSARPTASASGSRAIQLAWSPYSCGTTGTTISIYRREGCSPIQSNTCTTGAPAGFVKVGQVASSATAFTDTTSLRRGISYGYVLVAAYPDPNGGFNGGESIASTQVCLELPLLAPLITQVTVDSTSSTNGRITVRWTRPLGLNPGDLGGPYLYRLERAQGLSGTSFSVVTSITTSLQAGAADTVFVDRGLNTDANAYRYRLSFFYTAPATGQLTQLDITEGASSVRLATQAANRRIVLSWQASVPWSNDNQVHDVYRSRSGPQGPFNLIAQVSVGGPQSYTYADEGADLYAQDGNSSAPLSVDSSYCYRVMSRGAYTDPQLARLGLLLNYSQISCASPGDTTRPCPPRLGLDSLDCASLKPESYCDLTSFTNQLRWQSACQNQVVGYRLYYGRYSQDEPGLLASTSGAALSFAHAGLSTVAGCYYVTSLNRQGVESAPSNRVCQEACPSLVLPNVFTPNGDGKNDVFSPMRCPRFVESLVFSVYNRWGSKVYEVTTPSLAWDGRSSEGAELPSGLYYYQVSVRYGVLDRNAPPQVLKGWVQILRESVSVR